MKQAVPEPPAALVFTILAKYVEKNIYQVFVFGCHNKRMTRWKEKTY